MKVFILLYKNNKRKKVILRKNISNSIQDKQKLIMKKVILCNMIRNLLIKSEFGSMVETVALELAHTAERTINLKFLMVVLAGKAVMYILKQVQEYPVFMIFEELILKDIMEFMVKEP